MSMLADSFGMHNFLEDVQDVPKIKFDLPHQFTINTSTDRTGIIGDDNGNSCTFRTCTSAETVLALPPGKESSSNISTKIALAIYSASGTTSPNNQSNNNPSDKSDDQSPSTGKKCLSPSSRSCPWQ